MKKVAVLFLVLVLCFSLFAACNSGSSNTSSPPPSSPAPSTSASPSPSAPPASSPAPSTSPEPSAPAPESSAPPTQSSPAPSTSNFKWNGKKEIWSVLPTTQAVGLVVINDSMGADLQSLGWVYSKKDAEGQPGNQVTFIENAIDSGTVGAIMCAAMAVDLLKDVVQKALDAGIIVVYLGAYPSDYQISGCVYTSYALTGYYAISMVEAWAKQNNPPKDAKGVPVALDVYDDIVDGQYRSNAFRDRTASSDILYVYNTNVSYGNDAQNKGYAWAENMMTANPDLRIFVCYEPDCMEGVISYLNDYCDSKGLDKKDFCVVNCYQDDASVAEFDKAAADPSSTVYKGYVTYGDTLEATGLALSTIVKGAADGSWPFNQVYWDVIHSYAAGFDFVGEWKMGDPNPGEIYQY